MSAEDVRREQLATRETMAAEGNALVDGARARGLKLRLVGGLAVRDHCEALEFCTRDYSDLDMVSLRSSLSRLIAFFADQGYVEDRHAGLATGGGQARFRRRCVHGDGAPFHEDDHVDVFLDAFVMDHRIDLRQRLEVEPYTLPLADLLLTKLQIYEIDARDLRDAATILKDRALGEEDAPGVINAGYIAGLCGADWGMYHDVVANLTSLADLIPRLGLTPDEAARVEAARTRLRAAIEAAPKTRRWRWRAKVGTRLAWHNDVDERNGLAV